MYESIRGTLVDRDPASAVVDCGGLAYRIQVSLSTYERLPPVGETATLWLHLAVREDEWRLFGFAQQAERAGFRALIRVNGVGPAVAMSVLSGFTPAGLTEAVSGGDVSALTRVKGVGKKTAERIVVELRDVMATEVPSGSAPAAGSPGAEAVRALQALGQDAAEARRRVDVALGDLGHDADVTALVRRALRAP